MLDLVRHPSGARTWLPPSRHEPGTSRSQPCRPYRYRRDAPWQPPGWRCRAFPAHSHIQDWTIRSGSSLSGVALLWTNAGFLSFQALQPRGPRWPSRARWRFQSMLDLVRRPIRRARATCFALVAQRRLRCSSLPAEQVQRAASSLEHRRQRSVAAELAGSYFWSQAFPVLLLDAVSLPQDAVPLLWSRRSVEGDYMRAP